MNDESNYKLDPISGELTFVNPPSLPDVNSNEKLGSGRVTALLGYGGMANVYEIWDSQLEVHRAVKVIKPDCSKEALERFYTEIKITAKLNHPNIIDIHSVGVWKGLPYIEMERIKGETLRDVLDESGALQPKICTAIGILICRALIYAHQQEYSIYGKTYKGIIHRDLKPGNVMICPDGQLKLMDFGIARPVDVSFHTLDGTLVGTIQYMPPELLKGEKLDVRTDIYALGVTLYEILTGINAFPETNFSKLVSLKQKNQFQPLNRFKIIIPGRLRRLIHKCMQQDRKKRIDLIDDVLDELEKVHKKISSESPEKILKRFSTEKRKEKYIPPIGMAIPWNKIVTSFILVGIIGFAINFGMIVYEYISLSNKLQEIMETVKVGGSRSIEEFTNKIKTIEPLQRKDTLAVTPLEKKAKRDSLLNVYKARK
jgi:serine/threonine protein kinase